MRFILALLKVIGTVLLMTLVGRKLAERGNAFCQYNLGWFYYEGKGETQDYTEKWKDYKEAEKWFRKAAEQGHAEAQKYLGEMYAIGAGVTQDYVEAAKWYRKAAGQGHGLALLLLGEMYYDGVGVKKDYVEAHKWYNLAAAQGYEEARQNRDRVAREMTASQIAEAQRQASEWKRSK